MPEGGAIAGADSVTNFCDDLLLRGCQPGVDGWIVFQCMGRQEWHKETPTLTNGVYALRPKLVR